MTESIGAPERLRTDHDLSAFDSGEPSLDDWLRRRALANQESGASRVYAACSPPGRVVGYYALATGAVARERAPGAVRRNMPEAIPVMVLGRLAVDRSLRGRGLGAALLRDAVMRMLQVAEIAGLRALLVHALTESAREFYLAHGFVASPIDRMTLMVTTAAAAKALGPLR